MNKELRVFLTQLEKTDPKKYFLFWKFYLCPENSLGGSSDETLDTYYEFGDVSNFILDNTFFSFLKICMSDFKFNEKLNYNLLKKIRFILCDSRDFKNDFISDLTDLYLRDFCNGTVPLGSIYAKKYNKLELYFIIEHYNKYKFIYDKNFSKEKLEEVDLKLVDELISENTWQMDAYYDAYIRPDEERKFLLKQISTDDYYDTNGCFLSYRNGHDRESFRTLVCNNDFLKVIREDLLDRSLPLEITNNILEIINVGINFKTNNYCYENYDYLCSVLGSKQIADFDYREAKEIQKILQKKKRNTKVVKFKVPRNISV